MSHLSESAMNQARSSACKMSVGVGAHFARTVSPVASRCPPDYAGWPANHRRFGVAGRSEATAPTAPAFDGEPVADEESDGFAQLPGGDQIGTAAGRGMARQSGDGADLGRETGIGSQRLCFLAQEAGHGKPRIALRRHGSR